MLKQVQQDGKDDLPNVRHSELDAVSPDICDGLWGLRVKPAMTGI